MEQIPYTIVLGEKELSSEVLSVKERNGQIVMMAKEALSSLINEKTNNLPLKPIPTTKYLSKRIGLGNFN